MTHVRTQARAAVKAILDTELPGHKVHKGRRYKVNASELPMVDMRFAMEESRYQAMGTVKNHDAVLYVRVTRAASEDDIDDLLDADSVVIEEALEGEELGGVVKAVTHNATEFTDSADGNMVLAEMTLTFNVLYRADIGDVQTPRS